MKESAARTRVKAPNLRIRSAENAIKFVASNRVSPLFFLPGVSAALLVRLARRHLTERHPVPAAIGKLIKI